jgi:ABC-2 type transport system permease protein
MGFFISVIAKNQLAASQIALLATFLPAFLLSGFLYAIEQMPVALQWITRILPARYYVSVLKKIFLKGTTGALLYADLIPLAIFTLVLAFLATHSFQKKLT